MARSYLKAIVHIDGDSFFASCEVAKDPSLKGRPVVTGKERGIASAMTYEAKAAGVTRGMRLSDIKRVCPDAVILPSDPDTYQIYSQRMHDTVREYAPLVEEYGIDECFADITHTDAPYEETVSNIKKILHSRLGINFSVGLSATKVLAKIASKWDKPDGLVTIPLEDVHAYLQHVLIESIWGIGPSTSNLLKGYGIKSAYDLAIKDKAWVERNLHRPYLNIWHELNGHTAIPMVTENIGHQGSISRTRTFFPPSSNRYHVFSQLSKNTESACAKARRHGLLATEVYFHLKTQDMRLTGRKIKLPVATSTPQDILRAISDPFNEIHRPDALYRATGMTLMGLRRQQVLFKKDTENLHDLTDKLSKRYGKQVVFLGSSLQAVKEDSTDNDPVKRMGLPILGDIY